MPRASKKEKEEKVKKGRASKGESEKRVKGKKDNVVEVDFKKKGKKGSVDPSDDLPTFNPYAHLDGELDKMEKRFDLSAMSFDKNEPRFSVNLLTLNVMLAGGLLGGGWYTCFGGEQSCKSTLAMTILASIMLQRDFRGVATYFDYEGSSQAEYIENIMKYMGIDDNIESVFGVQDEETGEWLIKPRVRYYTPDTGETFFHYLAKLEKKLPDKIKKGGQWWYVYDNTRDNQKMLKGAYDKKLFAKHNRFYVPAPDGMIQAIVLTDSYPAMLPASADEKEEGDKGLALQARMFSDGIKRVKSAMRKKRIVVLGVNQLRAVPMAMYGPTETEPCGVALKFYSDVRFKNSSVSIPHGKGMIEEEESVVGDGDDKYRYIKIRTHKNKLGGIPNQDVTLRIVVEDANGTAKGFCRTWDSFKYLQMTGQVAGQRNKIKFVSGFDVNRKDLKTGKTKTVHIDFKSPLEGCTLTWMEFKTMIEGTKDEIRELCRKLKLKKPVLFRKWLEQQCNSGLGYALAKDFKKASAAAKRAKASAADDGDDAE